MNKTRFAPPKEKHRACASGNMHLAPWFLCVALLGCGDDANPAFGTTKRTGKAETTLYVNAGGEPEFFDPGRVSEAIGSLFASHLFEGLSVYDPRDAHATQGVAESYDKSQDNRFFRFHLRKNAVWSDGKPVTAQNFVFAWSRVLSPALASRAAPNLYVLMNGELYSQGKLKVTAVRAEVKSEPNATSGTISILPAGKPLRVVKVDGAYSQVAPHDKVPTFDPDQGADGGEKPGVSEPIGFVKTSELMESSRLLGVRALDDLTLEVQTERPAPYFLDLTCYPSLSPLRRDVIETLEKGGNLDGSNEPTKFVTNGAYTFNEHKFHYEIVTHKNPTYWRAEGVKINKIVWMIVEDYRSTLNLYKAGDLDYMGDNTAIPLEAMKFVATKNDFLRSKYLNVYWFELNTKKPPLNDVRVRKALNLGIDKALLIESVTRGGQIPATHYVPDYTGSGYAEAALEDKKAGTDPFSGPETSFDPEAARALLREAGYEIDEENGAKSARGFPPLELLYNTSEGHRAIAVAIQDFWKRHLGISVSLRNEEWKVMLKSQNTGNFLIVRGGWIADYNHPQTWLDTFLSESPQNKSGWADPEFDQMVKDAARTGDLKESIKKFRAAEKRAVDAMPKIPLYFYTKSTLVKPWLKGFFPNGRNVHLAQWLWIDETKAASNEPSAAPLEYASPGPYKKVQGQPSP